MINQNDDTKDTINKDELEPAEQTEEVVLEGDSDQDEYEKICFLCRRPESKTGPMIDLPQNIHICTDCMQKSFDTMNNSNFDYSSMMNMPNISMMNTIKYFKCSIFIP